MSIRDCYLSRFRDKLHLMIFEYLQVHNDVSDIEEDQSKLVYYILEKISQEKIKSSHFTPNDAIQALKTLDLVDGLYNESIDRLSEFNTSIIL